MEFEIREKVFLKIAPPNGAPFEILERIRVLAYRLALPPKLRSVHDVFHVLMLRENVHDPSHVIEYELLEVFENLTYEEKLVKIPDRKDQVLQNTAIPLVKVLWRNHAVEEATWEQEEEIKAKYPHLYE